MDKEQRKEQHQTNAWTNTSVVQKVEPGHWALRGQRVVIPHQQRYEWEYVYGALDVLEGAAQLRFTPSVNLDFSRDFLRQIATSDPATEHVVIWDQAVFHPRAGDPGLPERIHLLPLAPYSPELNPIEGLWDQVQDVT